ncbi:MAG: Na+-translocating NADH-quinone reductase subunit A [Candidatus Scalindua rubra]|uniref:Na+-translocating NADH-quinone reductase subunit A n=1 Tax=Candidatus Scalindua rubra TaxID=1872076 RepID=A0A1E3X7S0_9BACT|nr:MAG: Na+-translocating NADH-quinone reductase subunit A [Candidatus Scalindua rubra]
MNKKQQYKKVYKNGFNLIEIYPIKFSETVALVKYDGPVDNFNFSFPYRKVEHIIVSLCPTEPWAIPNWAILKNKTPDFLNKLETVRTKYFPDSHCHVVINNQETNLINEVNQYKGNADKIPLNPPSPPLLKGGFRGYFTKVEYLHLHTMDPIYPYDAPVLIVNKILGLNLSYGQNTTDIGVIILDPQSVIGIFEHYIQKNEFNTHLVPISGTGLKENKILKVKPGTPINNLLDAYVRKDIKYRVFLDGPLNGTEVKDLTQKVLWSTKNIVVMEEKDYKTPFPYTRFNELLFTTSLMGELRRCVYCNYCDDICPVGLEPALYWHCYTRGEKQKGASLCIGKMYRMWTLQFYMSIEVRII